MSIFIASITMKRATVSSAVLMLVLAGVGFVSAGAEDAPPEKAPRAADDAGKRGDSVKAETREF